MLKRCFNIIFLIGLQSLCLSQNKQLTDSTETEKIDSLKHQLLFTKDDSSRIIIMNSIGFFYIHLNVDSSLKYYNAGLNLARERSYAWGETRLMTSLSSVMEQQGKFPEALELLFKSLKIAEENNIPYDIARAYRRLADVYFDLENFPKATEYLLKALQIDQEKQYKRSAAVDHMSLGVAYEKMNKLDSAVYHTGIAFKEKDILQDQIQYMYETDGNIQLKNRNYQQAAFSYKEGLKSAQKNNDLLIASQVCAEISALYVQLNLKDSAILYALKGFNYGTEVSFKKGIMLNGNLLSELYNSTQPSVALKYYKIAAAAKDSLFGVNNIQAIQNLVSREEAKQKELEDAALAYRNKLRLYGLLSGLAVLLIIAFILYRNNRQKQKANILLQQQKEKVESTLTELKSAQAQLIQSEKMASLGELTAGIAHEIQNPLNFVNNFSEVNIELIDEMEQEMDKGNLTDAKGIAKDIRENEAKINQHGKRADAIVKGMLQHSRTSSGQKEPTDINALADEYLRLAYHGLRARDKFLSAGQAGFNAIPIAIGIETDFDNSIEKINVVPQDIGRAMLNLINNAFYAACLPPADTVGINSGSSKDPNYKREPSVWVSTKKMGDKVLISVRDNGPGIPQKILDKIFQPFFTTKPSGEGTGLGLSLSYDIVKAHGGEIKVETPPAGRAGNEGEGTTFTIQLPVK